MLRGLFWCLHQFYTNLAGNCMEKHGDICFGQLRDCLLREVSWAFMEPRGDMKPAQVRRYQVSYIITSLWFFPDLSAESGLAPGGRGLFLSYTIHGVFGNQIIHHGGTKHASHIPELLSLKEKRAHAILSSIAYGLSFLNSCDCLKWRFCC